MANKTALTHEEVKRLFGYLNYLKGLPTSGPANIMPEKLGEQFDRVAAQVVSDLSVCNTDNHPKIGYIIEDLIFNLEQTLEYNNVNKAILVGVGHLGQAILAYPGFENYGLEIVAAFDADPNLIGTEIAGIKIYSMDEMEGVRESFGAHIGIITAPAQVAQEIADRMSKCHIRGIWNFAPVELKVPDKVLVENENIAQSLIRLSQRMEEVIVEREIAGN